MKNDISQSIADELVKKIERFEPSIEARRVGKIISISDGVVKVSGLPGVALMERLVFAGGIAGVALNLEEDAIGAIVLGDYLTLKEGDEVEATAVVHSRFRRLFRKSHKSVG